MKKPAHLDGVAAARMQMALTVEPQSLEDLTHVSGFGKAAVTRHVRALAEAGMVHVKDWRRPPSGRGRSIALFTWGEGVHAARPTSPTSAERMRISRGKTK